LRSQRWRNKADGRGVKAIRCDHQEAEHQDGDLKAAERRELVKS
jgi:hypothetical protein